MWDFVTAVLASMFLNSLADENVDLTKWTWSNFGGRPPSLGYGRVISCGVQVQTGEPIRPGSPDDPSSPRGPSGPRSPGGPRSPCKPGEPSEPRPPFSPFTPGTQAAHVPPSSPGQTNLHDQANYMYWHIMQYVSIGSCRTTASRSPVITLDGICVPPTVNYSQ